jgi:hypothetical protein
MWNNTKFHQVWRIYIKAKEATPRLSEAECQHILKQHRLHRKLETSDWAFSKLCFIKYKINLSLYPKYIVQVALKSQLSWINTRNYYKNNFKSLKMLTTWSRKVGFAPTHSVKCGPSPKHVFHLSSRKVCLSAHIWFWNLQRQAWTGQHSTSLTGEYSYWLVKYQPCLKHQEIWILL